MITSFKGKYSFLSPAYPCKVYIDGIVYPSALNAYYSMKASSDDIRHAVAKTPPHAVRAFARSIRAHHDWDDDYKVSAMTKVTRIKFEDAKLSEMLISTHPSDIIYENPAGDMFWGTCAGVGKNHLGRILMELRRQLMGSADG